MSATRLLILGVMLKRPPIHGYDVRRELEMWGAEQWANIAYGSIYSALNKMAAEGLVEVVGTEENSKHVARTEYAITERGKMEFERLLRDFWWNMKPIVDPFQVALAFMNDLPHDELIAVLRHRARMLQSIVESVEYVSRNKMSNPHTPRHIAENLRLAVSHSETELRWIEEILGKVERGELP
ncbi:MAG TPA: PadR family transcriptional regulator [Ktedonobacteraceae bacterium]|nr:PadR family transcriptional regulator [Ktedonobacteraceae bacterium]